MTKEQIILKLKALREEQKISVNKIATLIGTSHTRVKQLEAGGNCQMEFLLKYAAAVGHKFELQPAEKIVEVLQEPVTHSLNQPVHTNGNGSAKRKIVIEEKE